VLPKIVPFVEKKSGVRDIQPVHDIESLSENVLPIDMSTVVCGSKCPGIGAPIRRRNTSLPYFLIIFCASRGGEV
jgi:hypothetical protein